MYMSLISSDHGTIKMESTCVQLVDLLNLSISLSLSLSLSLSHTHTHTHTLPPFYTHHAMSTHTHSHMELMRTLLLLFQVLEGFSHIKAFDEVGVVAMAQALSLRVTVALPDRPA